MNQDRGFTSSQNIERRQWGQASQVKNNDSEILVNFCKYLFNYIEQITTNQAGERELMKNYNLLDLFDMTEILLQYFFVNKYRGLLRLGINKDTCHFLSQLIFYF